MLSLWFYSYLCLTPIRFEGLQQKGQETNRQHHPLSLIVERALSLTATGTGPTLPTRLPTARSHININININKPYLFMCQR